MSDAHLPAEPLPIASPNALILEDTVRWLERAVIGLNLCPFAKSVHVRKQIHYSIASSGRSDAVLALLRAELRELHLIDAAVRDTTLIILPQGFDDFLVFNAFMDDAEAVLDELGLTGVVQIASFHPYYQFAGTQPDDVTNCTNRSPYPMLHLLREASIDRAVDAFPDAESIYERNMERLESLGWAGWLALGVQAQAASRGVR